jgi:hypothetical protein
MNGMFLRYEKLHQFASFRGKIRLGDTLSRKSGLYFGSLKEFLGSEKAT